MKEETSQPDSAPGFQLVVMLILMLMQSGLPGGSFEETEEIHGVGVDIIPPLATYD